jgi:hypothetical protein
MARYVQLSSIPQGPHCCALAPPKHSRPKLVCLTARFLSSDRLRAICLLHGGCHLMKHIMTEPSSALQPSRTAQSRVSTPSPSPLPVHSTFRLPPYQERTLTPPGQSGQGRIPKTGSTQRPDDSYSQTRSSCWMVDVKRGVEKGTIHTYIVDYDVIPDDQRVILRVDPARTFSLDFQR